MNRPSLLSHSPDCHVAAAPRKDTLGERLQLGFDGFYQGGKHPYMIKGNLTLILPNPHRKEISTDLLSRLLKQASLSRRDWLGE